MCNVILHGFFSMIFWSHNTRKNFFLFSKDQRQTSKSVWCLIYAIVNAQEHHFGSIWQIKNNRNAHEDAPSVLFKLLWFAQESLIWGWQTQEEIHIDALLNSFFFIHLTLLYDITLTFLFFELKKSSTGKKLKKKLKKNHLKKDSTAKRI